MRLRLLLGAALFGISLAGAYGQQQGFNLDRSIREIAETCVCRTPTRLNSFRILRSYR